MVCFVDECRRQWTGGVTYMLLFIVIGTCDTLAISRSVRENMVHRNDPKDACLPCGPRLSFSPRGVLPSHLARQWSVPVLIKATLQVLTQILCKNKTKAHRESSSLSDTTLVLNGDDDLRLQEHHISCDNNSAPMFVGVDHPRAPLDQTLEHQQVDLAIVKV